MVSGENDLIEKPPRCAMILEEPNWMEKGGCIVSIFFGGYIHVGPAESRVGRGEKNGGSFTGVVLGDEQVSNMVGVEHLPVQQHFFWVF